MEHDRESIRVLGTRAIEIDDPATWPADLLAWATDWSRRLRGTTRHMIDLALPHEEETAVLSLLGNRVLRGYHFTRLLDHEVDSIRREGLRPLTPELVQRRIDAAASRGFLSAADERELRRSDVFATGRAGGRQGQVCVVLSPSGVRDDPGAVMDLVTKWGGEGVYTGAPVRNAELRELGAPAVVVVDVRLGGDADVYAAPPLPHLLVGILCGCLPEPADLHMRDPGIPADDVIDVWRQGEENYDRLFPAA